MLESMLTGVVNNIGKNIGSGMLQKMSEVSAEMSVEISEQLLTLQSMIDVESLNPEVGQQLESVSSLISPVQPNQVQLLANPIQTEVIKINEFGNLATVPSALFITVWVSSLIGAVLLFFAGNKLAFINNRFKYTFQITQSLLPIVYGLFTGYIIT